MANTWVALLKCLCLIASTLTTCYVVYVAGACVLPVLLALRAQGINSLATDAFRSVASLWHTLHWLLVTLAGFGHVLDEIEYLLPFIISERSTTTLMVVARVCLYVTAYHELKILGRLLRDLGNDAMWIGHAVARVVGVVSRFIGWMVT